MLQREWASINLALKGLKQLRYAVYGLILNKAIPVVEPLTPANPP